jgi:hypothetical protein
MKTTFTPHLLSKTALSLFSGACLFLGISSSQAQTVPPRHDHVVMVIMENYDYSTLIGDVANCPYINKLAGDTMGALFTQSFAIEHPSQPNYLDLFSGGNQGVTDDLVPANLFTTPNLGAELIAKSLTFKGYSESLSSIGYNGSTSGGSGGYARKHAPWTNWMGSASNSVPTSSHDMFSNFPTSFSTLPTVSIVVPNLVNDMHNGSSPSNKKTGDTWLKNNIDTYVQWAKKNNSLLILTWDEDDVNSPNGNRIVTIFVGQNVKAGQYSEQVNHYRILRTLEDMYSLGYAGNSSTSTPILDCWNVRIATGIPTVAAAGSQVQIMPNPFNTETVLVSEQEMHSADFRMFNSLGEEVQHLTELNGNQLTVNRNNLSSGIYYYSLTQGSDLLSRGKMVIQ